MPSSRWAVAIHIRGFLTYLFPLVIDGFIAYGIRALLVLRDAPLRARLYVWTLFGTATAASIWANALHAVRLNEDPGRRPRPPARRPGGRGAVHHRTACSGRGGPPLHPHRPGAGQGQ